MPISETTHCPACGALCPDGEATCWLCGKALQDPPPPAGEPAKTGLFSRLEGKEPYTNGLDVVLRDGRLTPQELDDLRKVAEKYGLTDSQTLSMRAAAYERECQARLVDKFLSPQEAAELSGMLQSMGLQPSDVPTATQAIQHALYFQNIAAGTIPVMPAGTYVLNTKPGEAVHVEVGARIQKAQTVRDGYSGGYSGFSFRVARGVRFHLGGTRGHLTSHQEMVTVSTGTLSITNQRIAYNADAKAFSVVWAKVMSVQPYLDGIEVSIEGKSSAPILLYDDPSKHEVIAAICAYYLK